MKRAEKKNTGIYNIFGALIVLALVGLTIVVINVLKNRSDSYVIPAGSTVYDVNNEYIPLEEDAKLYKKADGDFYLKTSDKEVYHIGDHAVVLDKNTDNINIYGEVYKINEDGIIECQKDMTEISDFSEPGLYKMADRRYVMTGNEINSTDKSYSTDKYVYINIYKSGTAVLMNDEQYKNTVYPIMLKNGQLYLDISSEFAFYGENLINLKNVIGSSNEYTGDSLLYVEGLIDDEEYEAANNNPDVITIVAGNGGSGGSGGSGGQGGSGGFGGSGGQGGSGGSGGHGGSGGFGGVGGIGGTGGQGGIGGIGGTGGIGGDGGHGGQGGEGSDAEISALKWVELTSVTAGIGTIDVKYYVSDITNDYVGVYLLVEYMKDGNRQIEKIYLNKTSTNYTIRNCIPNTQYNITICYDAYFSTGGVVDDEPTSVKHDTISVRTGSDLGEISIVSLKEESIDFQIKLQKNYLISSGKIVLYNSEGNTKLATYVLRPNEIEAAGDTYVTCKLTFDSSAINSGDLLYIAFEDVIYDGAPFVISQQASVTYNR